MDQEMIVRYVVVGIVVFPYLVFIFVINWKEIKSIEWLFETDRKRELKRLIRERDFFEARVTAINEWRHKLPEREQKEICDILANGKVGKGGE